MTSVGVLVPSRGRPGSVDEMAEAWRETDAIQQAALIWILDRDDPAVDRYWEALRRHSWMKVRLQFEWQPMVPKLNGAAVREDYDVLGFMGDDHRPRTVGWAARLAAAHLFNGPSILYGPDGFQNMRLPTWWAMSGEIVRALGRMVPANVDHLYCDNSILELGKMARCIRYLPSVLVEHMHPVAQKGEWDEGYRRVNSPEQYEKDRRTFLTWLRSERIQQARMIERLRA